MATLPSLVLDLVHRYEPHGPVLASLDITRKVTCALLNYGGLPDHWMDSRRLPPDMVRQANELLGDGSYSDLASGVIIARNWSEKLRRFAREVESYPDQLLHALDRIAQLNHLAARWREERVKLAESEWITDHGRYAMFFFPPEGYDAEPENLVRAAMVNVPCRNPTPYPDENPGTDCAYDELLAAVSDWTRANAPPYVWGTSEVRWRGIDAASIREEIVNHIGDGGELEEPVADIAATLADNTLESSLDEHHEDAWSEVVDRDGLVTIISEWLERWFPLSADDAERRIAVIDPVDVDKLLDDSILRWNAKQNIVSYYPDFSVSLPAFPGQTMDDAARWLVRAEIDAEAEIGRLENSWPESTPVPA